MMALASVVLFGSGIALGTGECRLRVIFGSCQERAKQSAANIGQVTELTECIVEDVFELGSAVNDIYFIVAMELAALKSVQKEMLEIHNGNWKVLLELFEISSLHSCLT